ncbi:MAG: radical SAM protein [Acidobacteria bacterium]|nr:radical SAM protein [Acidobacteriota bacterium]
MRWLFGPVPSRRFGRSLGIDLFTRKTCTFNCVYCEVGLTPRTTDTVDVFAPAEEVLNELRQYLTEHHDDLPDFITFAGSGEPTLHRDIDTIIHGIREMTTVPVVLLTNGSLLYRENVLQRVLDADYLVPSLDAGCPETYQLVNRPTAAIPFEKLIEGLLAARKAYRGHYLLEVLLVDGINTDEGELLKLKKWIDKINPDAVQINTVFRPPAESSVHAVSEKTIRHFAEIIGEKAVPVAYYTGRGVRRHVQGELLRAVILKTVGIRPCTVQEMTDSIGVSQKAMANAVEKLMASGKIYALDFDGVRHIALVEEPEKQKDSSK